MQCNFGSFIGQYGVKAEILAKQLLKNNMVHFLGTDVHAEHTVYDNMPQILSELRSIIGEEKLKELTEINPELALNNKKIVIANPKHIKYSLKDSIKMKF